MQSMSWLGVIGIVTLGACAERPNASTCAGEEDCPPGEICLHETCVLVCHADNHCPPGLACNTEGYCSDPVCGDGIRNGNEVCDSEALCNASCSGWINDPGACGNGQVEALEACDDGNDDPCDGCRQCQIYVSTCGDGLLCPGELCDDANHEAWDGCSPQCEVTAFRVNTDEAADQTHAQVASLPDGGAIIVWQSDGQDNRGIYVRRYDTSLQSPSVETAINTTALRPGYRYQPGIAANAEGDVVVVWSGRLAYAAIRAQRLDAAGQQRGPEIIVEPQAGHGHSYSDATVAMDAGGDFIVAWEGDGDPNGDGYGVWAQRFDAPGSKQGGLQQINDVEESEQWSPSVAFLESGRYVAAWCGHVGHPAHPQLGAREFDASGAPEQPQFFVDPLSSQSHRRALVAHLGSDAYLVTWHQGDGLAGRILSPGGDSEVFEIAATADWEYAVTVLVDGGFAVVWTHDAGGALRGRRFGQDGTPAGDVFDISTGGSRVSLQPHGLTALTGPGGEAEILLVVSAAADADGEAVLAMHLTLEGELLYVPAS